MRFAYMDVDALRTRLSLREPMKNAAALPAMLGITQIFLVISGDKNCVAVNPVSQINPVKTRKRYAPLLEMDLRVFCIMV